MVEIRKDFAKDLFDSNLQSCFNGAVFTELNRMILKETCHLKLDKTGKFLSAILERKDALLPETESDRLLFRSFFDQV